MSNIAAAPSPRYAYLGITNLAILVWVFILASFLSVRERDAADLMSSNGIDLQIKLQVAAWFGLGLLAVYLFVRGRTDSRILLESPLCWYCLYATFAVFSTLYSLSPALTLFRAGQLIIVILLIVSLGKRTDRVYLLIFVFLAINWMFVLMANLGLDFGQVWIRGPKNMFMLYGRNTLEPWRFSSPIAHASQVSIVGAAGSVGLAMRTGRKELPNNLPFILFFALTVLLTVSRTAIAAMFIGFVLVFIIRRRFLPMILIAGILVPVVLIFTPVGDKVVQFGMRGQSAEEFQSLTGRSDIYRYALSRAGDALPLGEGFVAGRAKAIVDKDKGASIVHSHNLFIESAVSMGIPGVVLAVMVLFAFGRALIMVVRLEPDRTGVSPGWEPLVMALPIASFCILDRGFAAPVCPFVCLFVLVLTKTSLLLKESESAQMNETEGGING